MESLLFCDPPPEVLLIEGVRNKVLVPVAERLLPVAFLVVVHIVVVLRWNVRKNHLADQMSQDREQDFRMEHLNFVHVGALSEDALHEGAQIRLDVCIVQLGHPLSCNERL